MSTFFSKYPKINYDLFGDGSQFELTNISQSVIVNSNRIQDDSSLYTYYEIENGDRPDIVSHKLYGSADYYWTFFIINNFLREGYQYSWPLPSLNFDKMIKREYENFSVFSIVPTVDPYVELNATSVIDISFVPLSEEYIPYLKFVSDVGNYESKISFYDSKRHQCVVSDIHLLNPETKKRIEVPRESFVESTEFAYRIVWDDFVREPNLKQPEAVSKNLLLKKQWLDHIYSHIKQYDTIGYSEHIDTGISVEQYILSKRIKVAPKEYRWSVYSNAAYEYYSPTGDILTAYDVLTNKNMIFPKYKSFYEYESDSNDSKRMIKIIRPDAIDTFSDLYFSTLNDV